MVNEIFKLKNSCLAYNEISYKLNLSNGTVKSIILRNKGKYKELAGLMKVVNSGITVIELS